LETTNLGRCEDLRVSRRKGMKSTQTIASGWMFFATVAVLACWWMAHLYVFCKGEDDEAGSLGG
jgi:hypothetical protein